MNPLDIITLTIMRVRDYGAQKREEFITFWVKETLVDVLFWFVRV